MAQRDVVVIGASAGGIEAVRALGAQLPADLPAAVLVVIHTSPTAPGLLAEVLGRATRLRTGLASDGERLHHGRLYVAPPDHHMVMHDGEVRVTHGPQENGARPAVDPLFRSAAVSAGPRVIGIVLTGFLDDGAAGLLAVKRCGGITIVQDPDEAAYPDMPRNALAAAPAVHVLPVARMGEVLTRLIQEKVGNRFVVPPDLAREHMLSLENTPNAGKLDDWGRLVAVGCPDCGGPIWEHQDGMLHRYRCLIGHAFTARTLLAEQAGTVEASLWVAIRSLEEHARTLARLAEDEQRSGQLWMAFAEQAAEAREKAQMVRSILASPVPLVGK
jgi:two-component system chemotaxis response regulator CheB